MYKKTAHIVCSLLLVTTVLTAVVTPVKTARAQGTVPIGTSFDFNNIMAHMKDFVLDHMATLMAKQMLHQITIDTVNWINGGFKGSPAFLNNPQGFFLDAADQVSGAFIATGGPLSNLCSPFNLDIRLNLALQQSVLLNQRYACTLSTIIKNAGKGSINVTVGNGSTASDNDINRFMGGDFSYGGWGAFIAMSTEPQNNAYGSYLQAHSDILSKIAARQASINIDLNRGNGFMSWQSCTDMMTVDPTDYSSVATAEDLLRGDPTITTQVNKDGSVTYQSCKTQTPGSVISGTLQKQLNVPADELELANNINAVVDALVSQMVSQVLSKGLGALSSASGGKVSYTNQLQAEQTAIYNQTIDQSQQQTSDYLNQSQTAVSQYKAMYDQAVGAITGSKDQYASAKSCFAGKLSSSGLSPSNLTYAYGANQMANIDSVVNNIVTPLLASLTTKKSDAEDQLKQIQDLQDSMVNTNGSLDIQKVSKTYQNTIQASIDINSNAQTKLAQAKKDLANAQTMAQKFNANAVDYLSACYAFPTVTYVTSTF